MKDRLRLLQIIEWRQLKGVARFFFRHPLLFSSAVLATTKCLAISHDLFGNTHHKDNKANAFRHALWNMLLVRYAMVFENDVKQAVRWARKLTDWHEDFSPNDPLARTMDLHNNRIGRDLYTRKFACKSPGSAQLTQALLPLLDSAIKMRFPQQATATTHVLLYITDECDEK